MSTYTVNSVTIATGKRVKVRDGLTHGEAWDLVMSLVPQDRGKQVEVRKVRYEVVEERQCNTQASR